MCHQMLHLPLSILIKAVIEQRRRLQIYIKGESNATESYNYFFQAKADIGHSPRLQVIWEVTSIVNKVIKI